jgi:hypothetical protein
MKDGHLPEFFAVDCAEDGGMSWGKTLYCLLVMVEKNMNDSSSVGRAGRGSDDVGKAMRKAEVSHSAAVILRRAEAPNCYVRVGASHDFADDIFDDAFEQRLLFFNHEYPIQNRFRTLPNFWAC